MKPHYAALGSISTGTTETEDLINTFMDVLGALVDEDPDRERQLKMEDDVREPIQRRIDAGEAYADATDLEEVNPYWESDTASTDLNELLFDALQEYAPPYATFGAHPGDGADYGFWLDDMEEIKDQIIDDGGLVVDDLGGVPGDFEGEVLVVNDHGNATLYVWDGKGNHEEIWGIV